MLDGMPSNIFSQGLGTKSSKTVAQNIITKTPAAARLKLSTAQANSTNSPSTMSSLESVLASDVAGMYLQCYELKALHSKSGQKQSAWSIR